MQRASLSFATRFASAGEGKSQLTLSFKNKPFNRNDRRHTTGRSKVKAARFSAHRRLNFTLGLSWDNGGAWNGELKEGLPAPLLLISTLSVESLFRSRGLRAKARGLTSGRLKRMEKGKAKRRLVFVEDLSEQVKNLERDKENLTSEAGELRSALKELVEACEAGGTSHYMEALSGARGLLDRLDATEDDAGD